MSNILKSTRPHSAEVRTLDVLDLDPKVYIPMPDEYHSRMSKGFCRHHPTKLKASSPPPTKQEAAQLQRLISVIDTPVSSSSPSAKSTPPRKTSPLPVSKPPAKPSPQRRASVSSDDSSIVLTMEIEMPLRVENIIPTKSPAIVKTAASPIPKPPSVVKTRATTPSTTNSELPTVPSPAPAPIARETPLEWSARMRRYQQEEIQYLGLEIIRPHISRNEVTSPPKRNSAASRTRRSSPKRVVGDRSLSRQRFEEWLDTLSMKASPTIPASKPSTVADSTENIMDVLDLDAVCNGCIWDHKDCGDWGVPTVVGTGPLIDI